MTNISFHFNVADTHHYVCRLVKKAWQQEKPVLVVGEQDWLEDLDSALWTFSDIDFIPHAFVGEEADEVHRIALEHVWVGDVEAIVVDDGSTDNSRELISGDQAFGDQDVGDRRGHRWACRCVVTLAG